LIDAPELDELEAPVARAEREESESEDDLDAAAYEAQELSARQREAARMRHILAAFTPEQLDRYECFRRSVLNRKHVKRLVQAVVGYVPKEAALVVLAGLGKTFVGELVEEGKRIQAERGDTGPLRPAHVKEAHRRMSAAGTWQGRARRDARSTKEGGESTLRLCISVCLVSDARCLCVCVRSLSRSATWQTPSGRAYGAAKRPTPLAVRGAAARVRL
jgi:transcription initiation factor TFIID subunit 11